MALDFDTVQDTKGPSSLHLVSVCPSVQLKVARLPRINHQAAHDPQSVWPPGRLLLKVWSVEQVHQHPLELVRNADSQASPQTSCTGIFILTQLLGDVCVSEGAEFS